MAKGDNTQDKTGNFRRQMETIRNVQIEKQEIKKSTVTEIKNAIEWFTRTFNTVKERISKPKYRSI